MQSSPEPQSSPTQPLPGTQSGSVSESSVLSTSICQVSAGTGVCVSAVSVYAGQLFHAYALVCVCVCVCYCSSELWLCLFFVFVRTNLVHDYIHITIEILNQNLLYLA